MIVLACVCGAARARAQEMEVPVALQLPLLLKVLSFDRQLSARAGGTLVIAVAYQSGFRASAQVKDEMLHAAAAIGPRTQIGGLTVHVVAIDLDQDDLVEGLERSKATVVYLAPVRGIDVKALSAMTRIAHVTTVTGVPRYVEQGLSVGVRLRGDRPQILVNLAASRFEGAEFGAELLKLVQVL